VHAVTVSYDVVPEYESLALIFTLSTPQEVAKKAGYNGKIRMMTCIVRRRRLILRVQTFRRCNRVKGLAVTIASYQSYLEARQATGTCPHIPRTRVESIFQFSKQMFK